MSDSQQLGARPHRAGFLQPKPNLARVRDNQRRSRARKKEYVAQLEARIRAVETQGVEASQEVQQAARKVADENRMLRNLLNRLQVDDDTIDTFLRTGVVDLSALPASARTTPVSTASSYGTASSTSASQALEQALRARPPLKPDAQPSFSSLAGSVANGVGIDGPVPIPASSPGYWETGPTPILPSSYGRQPPPLVTAAHPPGAKMAVAAVQPGMPPTTSPIINRSDASALSSRGMVPSLEPLRTQQIAQHHAPSSITGESHPGTGIAYDLALHPSYGNLTPTHSSPSDYYPPSTSGSSSSTLQARPLVRQSFAVQQGLTAFPPASVPTTRGDIGTPPPVALGALDENLVHAFASAGIDYAPELGYGVEPVTFGGSISTSQPPPML